MKLEQRTKDKEQRTNKKALGFTLIELLVVISIIGILAALVLVSFTGAQRQARDTQRKSDLKQFQTALESYANQNSGFYVVGTKDSGSLCTSLGLTNCPTDPSSPTYNYRYTGTLTDYAISAELEAGSSTYWVLCASGKVGGSGDRVGTPPTSCPF